MPKYYCDYCDTYLTHDSPSVRKTHCQGRKHKDNVKFYYQKWMEDQAQQLIDATTAMYKAGKITGVQPPPMNMPPGALPPFPPMPMPPGLTPQGMMAPPPPGSLGLPPMMVPPVPPMSSMMRPAPPMIMSMPPPMAQMRPPVLSSK